MTIQQAAEMLAQWQDVLILSHQNPDGDTIGTALALYYAYRSMGVRARVECSDEFPHKYAYLTNTYDDQPFEPQHIVAVDVADAKLLGEKLQHYLPRIEVCIDHHPTNTGFAQHSLVVPTAAATAEVMMQVLEQMKVQITPLIASALYTGICTDTGCFRYSNTTADTHRAAARLIELGAPAERINRVMFETKSLPRITLEAQAMNTLTFHEGGKVAVMHVTRRMVAETGAAEGDLDGVSSIPRQIEGVEIGVTLREREDGYKVSMRTTEYIDASQVCATLGGGGHARAAGCLIQAPLEEARRIVVEACCRALQAHAASPER